jgi:amino acid transporter
MSTSTAFNGRGACESLVASGPAPGPHAVRTTFARALGPVEAGCIVIGTVIGAGIFVAPGIVAQTAGRFGFGAVLLVWLLGGLLSLAGAAACAELSSMFPRAGGQYVFLREAYGPLWGFLFGWMEFWVARAGSIAVLALLFAQYAGHFTRQDGEWGVRWTAFIMILTVTGVNYAGVRTSGAVQVLFTALKVAALGALAACAFGLPDGSPRNWTPFWNPGAVAPAGGLLGSVMAAMVPVMWAYYGWAKGAAVSEEMKAPTRDVPRALVLGVLTVSGIYVAVNLAYHFVLPMRAVAGSSRVASDVAGILFGPVGEGLAAAAVMIAAFGSANGMLLTGPRVFYAMARDGLFFPEMGELHPRSRTPYLAVLFQGLWAALLVLVPFSGILNRHFGWSLTLPLHAQLLAMVVFPTWAFAGLTVAGLFVLRRKRPALARPYRAWGYPWLPALFVLTCAGLVAGVLWTGPAEALAGLGVVLLGLPAYWWWSQKRKGETRGNSAEGC